MQSLYLSKSCLNKISTLTISISLMVKVYFIKDLLKEIVSFDINPLLKMRIKAIKVMVCDYFQDYNQLSNIL